MKRVYTAIAILLLIPLLIGAEQFYLKRSISNLNATLETAETCENAGQTQKAVLAIGQFSTDWENHKRFFETFVKHAELDPVSQELARVKSYLASGDKDESSAGIREIAAQLTHIRDSERLSMENIL